MQSPDVAVVVVTYNSAPLLGDLLRSLPVGAGDVTWRAIIVDNDSGDDSVAVVRRMLPEAEVVQMGRNAGYAAAINAGITAAGTPSAVLVLNPDVRLEPDCMPTLLGALRRPGVGIAVPRLRDADGDLIFSLRREPTLTRAAADLFIGATRAGRIGDLGEVVSDPRRYVSGGWTDWAEGSTLMMSRDCLRRVGRWCEDFFLYSEETEFALRARDHGYGTWYEPAARATHLEGGSATSVRLWGLVQVNRTRLFAMRHGRLASVAFWALTVSREASRALLRRPPSRRALRKLLSPRSFRETPGPQSLD